MTKEEALAKGRERWLIGDPVVFDRSSLIDQVDKIGEVADQDREIEIDQANDNDDTVSILRGLRARPFNPKVVDVTFEYLEKQITDCEKQIRLIEQSVLVYHMQRAPTRRVWYIDVGQHPEKARQILRDFKDEITSKQPDNTDPMQREEVFLPSRDEDMTQVEDRDIQTTWDGSTLLETFYTKRARLLSQYARLVEAHMAQNVREMIKIVCLCLA